MRSMREENYKWIWGAVFLIAAIVCFTLVHDFYMHWARTGGAISYLEKKSNTVLALTGAATSASVAITMMPGDIGTPIANELADISSYSIIVLAAIHMEKFLITIAGEVILKLLFPIAMLAEGLNALLGQSEKIRKLLKKICTLFLALVLVAPASVSLSALIEQTYHEDVELAIEQTQNDADAIKSTLEEADQSLWQRFVQNISGGTSALIGRFENSLSNFVEAVAVMLITACVLPILTFAVLLWMIKLIFQIDVPAISEMAGKVRIDVNGIKAMRKDDE